MIHKQIIQKSGDHTLQKFTKTQVQNEIERSGRFHGFLCGNRVNPFHVADGWCLGVEIDCSTRDALQKEIDHLENGLRQYVPQLGSYAHFYKIVDASERTAQHRQQLTPSH